MKKPPIRITVETFKEAAELDSLKFINWSDSSDRKWLMNHMTWAFHNSRQVTITPESF